MKILFIGFGNVAKEMARIFMKKDLYTALDISPEVIGIFTGRHGGLENKEGIDLNSVLKELEQTNRLTPDESKLSPLTPLEAAKTLIMMFWWSSPPCRSREKASRPLLTSGQR